MRSFNVQAVLVNGSLDRAATHAALDKMMDERVAQDTADFDLIGPVAEALFDASPALSSVPSSLLVEACVENAVEKLTAEKGEKPSIQEKVALRTRLQAAIPEYVKANSDQLHLSRKAGIRVRYSISESTNGVEPRISDEEWTKITTPAEKTSKGESSDDSK